MPSAIASAAYARGFRVGVPRQRLGVVQLLTWLLGLRWVGGAQQYQLLSYFGTATPFYAHKRRPSRTPWLPGQPLPQQFFRISRRHRQVRSAKPLQNREIHTDHFAVSIEERTTRPAGRSRCVVHNLVLQHISNMSLRGRWPYQFLL